MNINLLYTRNNYRRKGIAKLVNEKLLEQRIILVHRKNSETFRIDPSLTIRDEDINNFITSFKNAVSDVQKTFW